MGKIKAIKAREVLDSRGYPTVEAEVITKDGFFRAIVPSGASTGIHEALELRDRGKRYLGKGVLKAVKNVNSVIGPKLIGDDCTKQRDIDKVMLEIDGSENKTKLGANATLAVSMAVCKAGAHSLHIPLFKHVAYFANSNFNILPVPMLLMIEGGKHGEKSTDFQEFMIMPVGASSFKEALRYGVEIYHYLQKILKSKGHHTNVGLEGAFAPHLGSNEEAMELIVKAIEKAGYRLKDVFIAIDVAASEFFKRNKYVVKRKKLNSEKLIDYYGKWVKKYPIISIEDGLAQDDWEGWGKLNERLGNKIQIVGDDLVVTNVRRIKKAIRLKAINACLLKLNQIGTVSETLDAIKIAKENNFGTILSQRGGETEDTFNADFVVGAGLKQCKFGAPSRSERTCKYNQLLRIEEFLGSKAKYAGKGFR